MNVVIELNLINTELTLIKDINLSHMMIVHVFPVFQQSLLY